MFSSQICIYRSISVRLLEGPTDKLVRCRVVTEVTAMLRRWMRLR